jgi:ABC-type lipoprotein release transport system permease subunit
MNKCFYLKFSVFYAVKSFVNSKRSTALLFISMIISLVILFAALIGIHTQHDTEIRLTKNTTGNWHVAFKLEDKDGKKAEDYFLCKKDVDNVHKAFLVDGLSTKNVKEDIILFGVDNIEDGSFLTLKSGRYPSKQDEVIVPAWFSEKYNRTQSEIEINGQMFNIVGEYESDYQTSVGTALFYLQYDNNPLANQGTARLPYSAMSKPQTEETGVALLLVTLKKETDLRMFLRTLDYNNGLSVFQASEYYGICENESEGTPAFNGTLIRVQGFKNGGILTDSGSHAAKRMMDTLVIIFVLLIMNISSILYFYNKKSELNKTLGILKTLGVDSNALISLQLSASMLISACFLLLGCFLYTISRFIPGAVVPFGLFITAVVLNILIVNLSSFLFAVAAIIKPPAVSMRTATYARSSKKSRINNSALIQSKSKIGFITKLSLRTVWLNKKSYFMSTVAVFAIYSIALLFITQIYINFEDNRTKEKYDYDFWLTLEKDNYNEVKSSLSGNGAFSEFAAPIVYEQGNSREATWVLCFINKENITQYFKNMLQLSEFPSYIDNNREDVIISTGIIGFEDKELDILEKNLLEGSIDKVKSDENYILIPKYSYAHATQDITLTTLKTGDKIKVGLTNTIGNTDSPALIYEKEFIIAGLLDINPFDPANGNSNQFSIIMNRKAIESLGIKTIVKNIFVKAQDGKYDTAKYALVQLQGEYPLQISEKSEKTFVYKYNQEKQKKENNLLILIGAVICIVISIGLFDSVWVKIKMQKREHTLLRLNGLATSHIVFSSFVEMLLPFLCGCFSAILFMIFNLNKISEITARTLIYIIPSYVYVFIGVGILLLILIFDILSHLTKKPLTDNGMSFL